MNSLTSFLLRIGVAFAFLYPPVSALINPLAWVGFFPGFISSFPISEIAVLHIFGLGEVIIGLWILSGKKIFIPSILAATSLFLIVAFNLSQIDILFRDISILLMAGALALDTYQKMPRTRINI